MDPVAYFLAFARLARVQVGRLAATRRLGSKRRADSLNFFCTAGCMVGAPGHHRHPNNRLLHQFRHRGGPLVTSFAVPLAAFKRL